MKKLFTLAAAVLATLTMVGQTTLWETDCVETITGVTQTKGRSSDSWGDAPAWASPYTKSFNAGGSSSTLTFTFDEALSVPANAVLHIYWGATSNRTLTLQINGSDVSYTDGNVVDNSSTKPRSTVMDATYTFTSATTLNSFRIGTGGSNTFWLHVAIITTCSQPATPLSITSDASDPLYEGNTIHLTLNGGNGATKVLKLDGTEFEYLTWLAVAGEHTFTVSQEANEGYCEQTASLTLNVLAATPVTACTVDGPTSGVIGTELVYTATAANATDFEWYLDGAKQGSDSAKFIYTALKGSHQIFAIAYNEFNTDENKAWADPISVTGTKLCGELIKAVYDANTKTSTVTGVVGGTADRNTQDNGKLGSNGHYYGVALTSGSFMFGDTVTVVASTLNGGNTATIYADKTGTTLLGSVPFDTESKTAKLVLSQGASVVYLYRKDSGCNPNIESLSVSRACAESDNKHASVKINGELLEFAGTTAFNYTLSSSYTDPTVGVEIILEHPLATLANGHATSFTMATPEVGNTTTETFTVVAEDESTWLYVITISKSASLDDDATLKSLSVAGLTLDPEFDADVTEYTVTKAYEAAMPTEANVTAEANSSNAKSVVVAITDNVITVTVTAENDDTKVYTITVNNAPAVKKINEIILSNGYSAYIPEGQTVQPFSTFGFYLAGQDAPTVSSYKVNEGTTWAIDGNNITLTGADNSTATYYLTLETVTPADFSADEITFDGTEAWVKAANGFGADKGGWKFSKTDNDFSREIAGKTHVEFFLPACDTVVLKTGENGTERDVRFYVNGTQFGDKAKITKAGVALAVEQSAPFMLTIASAQTSGDGGIGAIRMARKPEDPTGINNTEDGVKAVKVIRDGQLLIIKGDKIFNIIGAELR